MIRKVDRKNQFVSLFNPDTGYYLRAGFKEDPFMADFPELIDVGVMGHCKHGKSGLCLKAGIECYQSGATQYLPNMTLDNFKRIVDECKGKTFQFALGGRGDVDQHENFEELLAYTRQAGIVPNFTSSGFGFNKEIAKICKRYCGAVAISWYRSSYTIEAIQMLLEEGVSTNIHYVLGNNSIEEAIERLEKNDFPKGIHAVVFLLHKPVGLGRTENVIKDGEKIQQFFEMIDKGNFDFEIGFDSCSVPGILQYAKNIDSISLDTCEGGRWSAYISSDMLMMPCSFDNDRKRWAYDISNDSIANAWHSPQFENFRERFRTACPECEKRQECFGGCPICPEIVLCSKKAV